MVAFVEKDSVDAFSTSVRETYFNLTQTESEVYPVEAEAGAEAFLPPAPVDGRLQRADILGSGATP